MKITAIKQQVKRSDRYSIYVDDAYAFPLGESELLKLGLYPGLEVTAEGLEQLKSTAHLDKAYDRVLNLVSRRLRSEWEIRQYLKRKDYDEPVIDRIVALLAERGYLDDRLFAEAWVRNRRLLKPISVRRLRQELSAKRVADEVIDEVVQADTTDELEVLRQLVAKKQKIARFQDVQKLMAYLARQGYNFDDIKTVLRGED